MAHSPKEGIERAAGMHLPTDEILQPPGEVPPDDRQRLRPEHEVVQVLVEEEHLQGSQSQSEHPHSPVRHLRLQNHSSNANGCAGESRAAEVQVLLQSAASVERDPASYRWPEFGDNIEVQLRVDRRHAFEKLRNQFIGTRRNGELDWLGQNVRSELFGLPQTCPPRVAPTCPELESRKPWRPGS